MDYARNPNKPTLHSHYCAAMNSLKKAQQDLLHLRDGHANRAVAVALTELETAILWLESARESIPRSGAMSMNQAERALNRPAVPPCTCGLTEVCQKHPLGPSL